MMTKRTPENRPNNLAAWRLHANLTQDELAGKVETSQGQIAHLEAGRREITEAWLKKIAVVYKIRPGILLDFTPEEFYNQSNIPTASELTSMLEDARKGIPSDTPYGDWPEAVAGLLHIRLERYASGGGIFENQETESKQPQVRGSADPTILIDPAE